jgi:hypothetical protein
MKWRTKIMLSGACVLATLLALAGCSLTQLNQAAGLLNPLLGTWAGDAGYGVLDTATFNFDNTYLQQWTLSGVPIQTITGTFTQDGTTDTFVITALTSNGASVTPPQVFNFAYSISSDKNTMTVKGVSFAFTRQSS